jgi:CHAT domain
MSFEFRIEFAPNGNDVRLNLKAELEGAKDAGEFFDRSNLDLSATEIDRLRLGTAGRQLVDKISAEVSKWLLSNDLKIYLNQAFAKEKVRVVLSFNDEQMRSKFGDIPFELCTPSGGGVIPVVLREQVESVVHLLPKAGIPSKSSVSNEYPLRILLVRSNPLDLGGSVPPASVVLDEINSILDEHQVLNRNLVQVHILSSESSPAAVGKPMLDDLSNQLRKVPYDILVYLGHGEVLPIYPDSPPVGVLHFETGDASGHTTVSFDKLTFLLQQYPVPVVLLVGCLTAADVPAEMRPSIEAATPLWMRGSQAVAQALINSESGVQIAVGMRFRLETSDAKRFLKGFFRSLFDNKAPGNVEVAVRSARSELKLGENYYSWSSPVIFRSLAQEPMFPFLASPPPLNCPNVEKQQSLRTIFWNILSEAAWSSRVNPTGVTEAVRVQLNNTEQELVKTILQQSKCLILPGFIEARHQETIKFPVNLRGRLKIEDLRGTIAVGSGSGQTLRVKSLEPTPQLLANGYKILSAVTDHTADFIINKINGNADLPEGALFEVEVELGQAYPAVHSISLSIEKIQPQKTVCVSSNAIVVPPP